MCKTRKLAGTIIGRNSFNMYLSRSEVLVIEHSGAAKSTLKFRTDKALKTDFKKPGHSTLKS
jgi:hypothetical protein